MFKVFLSGLFHLGLPLHILVKDLHNFCLWLSKIIPDFRQSASKSFDIIPLNLHVIHYRLTKVLYLYEYLTSL